MEGGPIYRWEQGINATWDAVQEDEQGNLIAVATTDRERLHRNRQQKRLSQSIRRGIIRYLVVALDCSESALETDYRPCRLQATSAALQKFVDDYYDQNPISQLSVILTRDRIAEKCSDLSGNARSHIDHLRKIHSASDLASLESCILLAMKLLRHIPNYGHRELLIVFNSLSSCDAGDIFQTIQKARNAKLRISVISTTAEVFICRQLAELTGGTFHLALDALHLSQILQQHTVPPSDLMSTSSSAHIRHTEFIRMGFPRLSFSDHRLLGYEGKHLGRFTIGYTCPRCYTRTSDIPTKCTVCQLQLNSSSHIARSFHHLFPVPAFYEFQVKYMRKALLRHTTIQVKSEFGTNEQAYSSSSSSSFLDLLPDKVFVAERISMDIETYYTDDEEDAEQVEKNGDGKQVERSEDSKDKGSFVAVKTESGSSGSDVKRLRITSTASTSSSSSKTIHQQIVLSSQCSSATVLPSASFTQSTTWEGISCRSNHCYGCSIVLHPPVSQAITAQKLKDSKTTIVKKRKFQDNEDEEEKEEESRKEDAIVTDKILFQCPRCQYLFCIDCDIFIHDSLHNCPGCPF